MMSDHHHPDDAQPEIPMTDTLLKDQVRHAMALRAEQIRPSTHLRDRINRRLDAGARRQRAVYVTVAAATVGVVALVVVSLFDTGQRRVELAASPPSVVPVDVAPTMSAPPPSLAPLPTAVASPSVPPPSDPRVEPGPQTPAPTPRPTPPPPPSAPPAGQPAPTAPTVEEPVPSPTTPPAPPIPLEPAIVTGPLPGLDTTYGQIHTVDVTGGEFLIGGVLKEGENQTFRVVAGPGVLSVGPPDEVEAQVVSFTAGIEGQPPAFENQPNGSIQLGLGEDVVVLDVRGLAPSTTTWYGMLRFTPATAEGDGTDSGQPPSDDAFIEGIQAVIDGTPAVVNSACRDQSGVLHLLVGAETDVTLDTTTDPATVTISSEGFAATSDSVTHPDVDGDAFQIDATFAVPNEFGAEMIRLTVPFGNGPIC